MPDPSRSAAGKADWADRLYPYKNKEPLFNYVKPGCELTEAEHNLNRGALRGKWQFIEKVLPGGDETKYIHHPEVAIGNWWERCCAEKPGFATSVEKRLPDYLTGCSEYREAISERARFFKDFPVEASHISVSEVSKKHIPMEVMMDHRSEHSPLSWYQSIYTRDFQKPHPAIPPQQFDWADAKRKKWISESLDDNVVYCTEYQKNYEPKVYEKQANEARRVSLCPYIKIDEQNERVKRSMRPQENASRRFERDLCLKEIRRRR